MSDFRVRLLACEDALILTVDGKSFRVRAHDMNEFYKNADKIHEMMIAMMKKEEAQNGVWAWKVCENWNAMAGWEIRDDEVNDLFKL